ncbi:hypothetical protein AYO49_01060 [Verrucomicrobiaceae bacterium SCGC AG-212-N21]|nr:hypothetical protein AYO49_01060 [Verrucomicrobiaceae bacterium SCGC AG-212-N21]
MSDLSSMVGVILAGGLGTRLRSVVTDRPKVLAEVRDRAFIEYLLDQLENAGVRSVVLCTGYKGEQVEQHLGAKYGDLELHYSREQTPLGTGGALRLALPLLASETVLVLNGDSLCDVSLDEFAGWQMQNHARAAMTLTWEEDPRRYGRVDVDETGRIVHFHEKSVAITPGWINAGVYLLQRDLIASIAPDTTVGLEREVFPTLIGNGLWGYCSRATMWDIGIPDAYELANSGQIPLFAAR